LDFNLLHYPTHIGVRDAFERKSGDKSPHSMPPVGLFIPCYIDQLYPQVGMATVQLLEHFGVAVDFPEAQTCCGQPMANAGCTADAQPLAHRFVEIFAPYQYIVAPSGSCVAMVRHHYHEYFPHGGAGKQEYESVRTKTFELTEFLVDVLGVTAIEGAYPHRVGLHQSCHGLRELRLASSSELAAAKYNKARRLLESLAGITLVDLARPDECCGFGGTFAVSEEAVSCMMGRDRIHDHLQAGAEVITANDMSCLMHLDGLIRRDRQPLRVLHIAELLVEAIRGRSANLRSVGDALRGVPEAPTGLAITTRPIPARREH
jgi:L-lactate dehydrogenase complex protein LldE